MFKCMLIKRKLYDYLDNSLSEIDSIKVKKHLDACQGCLKALKGMTELIEIAKIKNTPEPSEEFWHDFKADLDRKLNERLVSPLRLRPGFSYRLRPAFALPVVLFFVLTISLYVSKLTHTSNSADSGILAEVALLQEVSPESNIVNGENSNTNIMDEINLFENLGEGFSSS